ncbi:MAG: aminomethyl-transferring glycine dehydrogenase subunit GcvPA [Proteobacteria bacterium]|nr:aminomethyl-transferring glycine dehydrogenase subunit GcvPA [Pseudomonadota bacterium]
MRYLGLTDDDRAAMLSEVGVGSIDDLYRDVPKSAQLEALIDLPLHQGEIEVERAITALAARNTPAGSGACFLGAGAYRHHVPASVDYIIQRGEFLTSYTPYQPEISQGTLQYLFEFQTQVAMITGMEIASASHYDGATSCAEAVLMARRLTKRAGVVLSGGLHPHYRGATETDLQFLPASVKAMPPDIDGSEDLISVIDEGTSCVVVQSPDIFGRVRDLTPVAEACHAAGALLVAVVTEPLSMGLVRPPGDMGADIVAAEGQAIGNSLNFGGPCLGLFATREKFVRQMPGRIAGEARDADGRRGWVLTLSAREQHIRREKATSNICTNSGLCALAFTIHLSLLGEDGYRRLAELNHVKAIELADGLAAIPGVEVLNDSFFNEFTVRLPVAADGIVERLAASDIFAGVPASRLFPGRADCANLLIVAATERNSAEEIRRYCQALRGAI